jgi:hypothetical protein
MFDMKKDNEDRVHRKLSHEKYRLLETQETVDIGHRTLIDC